MAFVLADRVRETSTSTGTGNISLDGAADGREAFSDRLSGGDETVVLIQHTDVPEWEVSLCQYDANNNELSRVTVLSSSNNDSLVDFSSGEKDVLITPSSEDVVSRRRDFDDHSSRHEQGGSDELNVEGLPGELADPQDPKNHGNEAHTEDFETESGAQSRVDSHSSDDTGVHGVGTDKVAKSSREDQWPDWEDVQGKPSEFPPESHELDSHSDVNVSTPSDGDVLTFDDASGDWEAEESVGIGDLPSKSSPVEGDTVLIEDSEDQDNAKQATVGDVIGARVPPPSSEADERMLEVQNGSLTYTDPPEEGVPEERELTAGTLLTGGGDLSEDRTFNVYVATISQAESGSTNLRAMTPARTTNFWEERAYVETSEASGSAPDGSYWIEVED